VNDIRIPVVIIFVSFFIIAPPKVN
jgi:hypothetical protein